MACWVSQHTVPCRQQAPLCLMQWRYQGCLVSLGWQVWRVWKVCAVDGGGLCFKRLCLCDLLGVPHL
jgi:hypothetical protein